MNKILNVIQSLLTCVIFKVSLQLANYLKRLTGGLSSVMGRTPLTTATIIGLLQFSLLSLVQY